MSTRILTLQRQARELGRLRTGFIDGRRPVRSDKWIISSHSEDYVRLAASQWGGVPEPWSPQGGGAEQWRVITSVAAIDAVLPSGDPLSQANELWSGGGCTRRCDGITESLTGRPCLCLAQFGDSWHEQEKGTVCSPTSRLNVFLPDMPDVGVWRVETHSYYAAGEIAGAVDLVRAATGGDAVLPIRLRIEQRQRKAGGQTKKFPVIVVELRGVTTGQVLSGTVSRTALGTGSPTPAALTTGPAPAATTPGVVTLDVESTTERVHMCTRPGELRDLWRRLNTDHALDDPTNQAVRDVFTAHAKTLEDAAPPGQEPPTTAALAPDPELDQLWTAISAGCPAGWTAQKLETEFEAAIGVTADEATADQMRTYLELSTGGAG
jgi:hypothetical protein